MKYSGKRVSGNFGFSFGLSIYIETEKTVLNTCPSCRKGQLITLLTFGSRGPPKNYKAILKRKIQKYTS